MVSHIDCPGCRTLLAIPDHLAGKVLRCQLCKTNLPYAAAEEVVNLSEAITDRPTAPLRSGIPSPQSRSPGEETAGPEARIQLKCEGCSDTLLFAVAEMGTVQECPACGAYIDVPDLTTARYERQLRESDRQLHESDRLREREERLLGRWEVLVDRLERALARWEQLHS